MHGKGKIYITLCLLTAILVCGDAHAQQNSFLYIQSENNQPYYVQWNGSTYNSSVTGYLLITEVPAGGQTLLIGFPQNQFQAHIFTCITDGKPRGLTLRLSVDNTWRLFDMVQFTAIKGRPAERDEIARLMKKPADQMTNNKATDSSLAKPSDSTGIQKLAERPGTGGINQVYIVNNGGKTDTVDIYISDTLEIPVKPVTPHTAQPDQQPIQKQEGPRLITEALVRRPETIGC